ncbi:hypothetical protein [Bacillus sp. FJAT-49736]|uniref:hypothetical protein n=1 Tax=Bacillus sp. FJAT-49736 TaxID=2833582 RepID=UPI001BC8E093|nr:hypothetical protein [Bacillus sp. FJAT-49736]MBS4173469.1 hypothetical protein [Bacillus sp. FJAT-49736]
MKLKIQYFSPEEREKILSENSALYLVEEQNIIVGNFLIFSDTPAEKEVVYVNLPQKELELLKAQVQANADRTDFHEDCIAEMAMVVYQ